MQRLYLAPRQHYVNDYKIRRAVAEDNDDLVPLIDSHSTLLKELYGPFYVAEMITAHQNSRRQLIVAEHQGYAVATMCLNEEVNVDSLNENFKLEAFYGLRKSHREDKVSQSVDPVQLQERVYTLTMELDIFLSLSLNTSSI